MESDSIRPSGASTLVDVWIDGKVRAICVSRGAIEAFLRLTPDQSQAMTEDDRCGFVRTNLPLVIAAAKASLSGTNADADSILIGEGQLGGEAPQSPQPERRKGADRRKGGERRTGDRVRGDRRQGDRRT